MLSSPRPLTGVHATRPTFPVSPVIFSVPERASRHSRSRSLIPRLVWRRSSSPFLAWPQSSSVAASSSAARRPGPPLDPHIAKLRQQCSAELRTVKLYFRDYEDMADAAPRAARSARLSPEFAKRSSQPPLEYLRPASLFLGREDTIPVLRRSFD